jgi:hypothetical protein
MFFSRTKQQHDLWWDRGPRGVARGCRNVTVGAWFMRTGPLRPRELAIILPPELTQVLQWILPRPHRIRWNLAYKIQDEFASRKVVLQIANPRRRSPFCFRRVNSGTSAGLCNIEADAAGGAGSFIRDSKLSRSCSKTQIPRISASRDPAVTAYSETC